MATLGDIQQYADFLAEHMPQGMVIGRFEYDGAALFHPDLTQLQTYIEA